MYWTGAAGRQRVKLQPWICGTGIAAVEGGRMARRAPQPVLRVVLTRELIVHAAVQLVEREGARALSMRAVAVELGVSAMAMYRHVPSKDALIEGIAEYVMAGLDVPEDPATDWKAGARALMHAFRATAEEYPRSLALVVASRIAIPVGLRAIERALSLCADAGLDGPTSVHVTRAMMAYALGSQLREATRAEPVLAGRPRADRDRHRRRHRLGQAGRPSR
jgi:AcrR family transcriptional regulator